MILILILASIVTISANPFHKYPYVFLLDVGNEELEKVNSEQIRLSAPGGSVAIRYPAIGDGDDIAHVRVSGIDFGTELKATILDGGPGYKYVVIVLMGNQGAAYDAVLTVQTVPDAVNEESIQTIEESGSSDTNDSSYQVLEEDQNDSAEDLSESQENAEASHVQSAELPQGSSNVYKYAQNEALSGYGQGHRDFDDDIDNNDYENNVNNEVHNDKDDSAQYDSGNVESGGSEDDIVNEATADKYTSDDDYSEADESGIEDQNINARYHEIKSQSYAEEGYPKQNLDYVIEEPNEDYRPVDGDEDYEEEGHRKYIDTNNNNFIDTNGASAVEY